MSSCHNEAIVNPGISGLLKFDTVSTGQLFDCSVKCTCTAVISRTVFYLSLVKHVVCVTLFTPSIGFHIFLEKQP